MLATAPRLADKAILVKLTTRRATLTKRDNTLTQKVRALEGDAGLTVFSTLFADKTNPVNRIMSRINEAYAYHKKSTLPYVDAGPRVLPNANYFDYAQTMRGHILAVDNLKAQYLPSYDALVQQDLNYRSSAALTAGKAFHGTAADYPTADQFDRATGLEFRPQPLPDSRHFLFDLSEDDLKACQAAEDETMSVMKADVVNRMLKPLSTLVDRLAEYQGQKGERFHNTVISNVLDGVREARRLMIDPSPEFLDHVQQLEDMAGKYLAGVEMIKGSAHVRADARAKLAEAAEKMSAYF